MESISQADPCGAIISCIVGYAGSNIPIPALSKLLGVKSTTLNARFRRQQLRLRTIGRTNYVPCDLALQLVELHRYALIGWPTLRAASKITEIRPGTLKARCEKGQLEGHVDLTKRLRLNPAELGTLCSARARPEGGLVPPRFGARAKLPAAKNKSKAVAAGGIREESRNSGAAIAALAPDAGPAQRTLSDHGHFVLPLAPEPKIAIIRPEDYGLPEEISRPHTAGQRSEHSKRLPQPPPLLVYDPFKPFSLSECSRGKTIRYGQYTGTILGLINDPFKPMIKVAFPEHPLAVMREVLLAVDKKNGP